MSAFGDLQAVRIMKHNPQDPKPEFLRTHGIALRQETGGMIVCDVCGSYLAPIYAAARALGVSEGSLRKWLKGQSIRPDVAAKLRSWFKAVQDGA